MIDYDAPHAWGGPALLNHAGDARTPETLDAAWRSPLARVLLVDAGGRFVADPFGLPASGDRLAGDAFLGYLGETPWFARRVDDLAGGQTLREAQLDHGQTQVAGKASAILRWHAAAVHCEKCGNALTMAGDGFSATCPACNTVVFPRTDPAVIVAVLDDQDRILLAHQGVWGKGRISILAGFVESGESAEHTIFREIMEEAKVEVTALRYLGSQPWPFPRSLMLGYVARGHGRANVDGIELEWGAWFSRDELTRALEAGEVHLPNPTSIARRIIDGWRANRLPAPESGFQI